MTYTESVICSACNGSGEGSHENTTCQTCNGDGEVDFDFDFEEEPEPEYVYKIVTNSYCGMTFTHGEYSEPSDADEALICVIERRRYRGYEVVALGDGTWEVLEPKGCAMVPDACGILSIKVCEK